MTLKLYEEAALCLYSIAIVGIAEDGISISIKLQAAHRIIYSVYEAVPLLMTDKVEIDSVPAYGFVDDVVSTELVYDGES